MAVVELSLYAFAPSAAAVLADWGADVVKIVPPTVADPMMGSPIARLPEHERALVALRYGADLSYDDIATTMRLPLGTVKTRLFRARQRLAGLLKEEGDAAS